MLTDQDIQKLNSVLDPKFDAISKRFDVIEESIDSLAIITKRGFENCVSKEEFNDFKDEMYSFKDTTEKNLFNLDSKVQDLGAHVGKTEETLQPLVEEHKMMKKEIQNLNAHKRSVEQKLGLAN